MTTTLTTSNPPLAAGPPVAPADFRFQPPTFSLSNPPLSNFRPQTSDFRLPPSGLDFSPPPFPIAGFRYYDGEEAFPELQPGTTLTLRAEPDNPHDPCAVEILHRGRKLGYVPRFCNRRVSQLLQEAVPVRCEVARISADAPPWDAVAVRVSVPQTELLAA